MYNIGLTNRKLIIDKMKIDLSVPKRQYGSIKAKMNKCPECGKELIVQLCVILLRVECATDAGDFFTNSNGARFCAVCPVVVFDDELLNKAALISMKNPTKLVYGNMGIVDIESIPVEKRGFEIGSEENPTPLVPFLPELVKPRVAILSPSQNGPCICGSGKKYKRCCGK